ncbi:CPBP family intramembrane glutamic endopeptidase [Natrialbaceae archaeon GCM10025810]|uniref:CPBP family intramembrane glutamic endopeptidase n=1 Tax=Halovalidus salilacus TaxID=3075124 RepID=UPI00360D743E
MQHVDRRRDESRLRVVVLAFVLAFGGLVLSQITVIPAMLLDPTLAVSPADASRSALVAMMALGFFGWFLAGAIYLWRSGLGVSYLDVRSPTLREWGYAVAGVFAMFGVLLVVNVGATALGVDSGDAEAQVLEIIGDDPTIALLMIAIVFLFNAPAEEFLFRNVIQKRLYSVFTKIQAVVVTSLVFAIMHLPTYGLSVDGDIAPLPSVAVALVTIFGGSLVFGYIYARTDNIVVPTVAHAFFNAIQFGLVYLALRYGPEEFGSATSTLVGLLEAAPGAVPV